eukprot:3378978-Prymnesium_polylepis.1
MRRPSANAVCGLLCGGARTMRAGARGGGRPGALGGVGNVGTHVRLRTRHAGAPRTPPRAQHRVGGAALKRPSLQPIIHRVPCSFGALPAYPAMKALTTFGVSLTRNVERALYQRVGK